MSVAPRAALAVLVSACAVGLAGGSDTAGDRSVTAAPHASDSPRPAASAHPRLLITPRDVRRLRSWASASNPMYARGLSRLARDAKADMDAGKVPGEDTGSDAYDQYTTEAYAELFAFMSLIERRSSVRADYGRRARSLLMAVMRVAGRGRGSQDQRFRDPEFATGDRSRWNGEAFALTVDWAYPYFSEADKRLIRKVFLRWSKEQFGAYPLSVIEGAKPRPGGRAGDPALVANRRGVRTSLNNYYLAHARNLGLMALALDQRDDPGNRLRGYLRDAVGQWLFVIDDALRTDARGGLSPEGFHYGPDALGRVAQLIYALRTAGHDADAAGRPVGLSDNPFWAASVPAFLSSLPTRPTRLDGDHAYLGDVFQPAWFGDAQNSWAADPIALFGPLALDAAARGDRDTVQAVRWAGINVAPGGRAGLYDRVGATDQFFAAIFYFLVYEPGAPAPADPRTKLPTGYFSPGLGRTVARTCWCSQERIFTHKLSWNQIDHQVGDGNDLALFRAGEWLTRQRAMYDGGYPDYKNVLAIQNDAPEHNDPEDPRHRTWLRGGQWDAVPAGDPEPVARSSGDGYLALTGDATNLYNSDYEGVGDVVHASRSIVWLEPDRVLVYDRATTGKAGRFKRFWLQLPSEPAIDGNRAAARTERGQQLFVTSLLPDRATLAGSRYEDEGTPANADPMAYRLSIEDAGRPRDSRLLTVIEGADPGASPAEVARVRSSSGTRYDGVVIDRQAVLFRTDPREAPERTVVELPAEGMARILVTGLEPGDGYTIAKEIVGDRLRLTVSSGGGVRADDGGVLVVSGVIREYAASMSVALADWLGILGITVGVAILAIIVVTGPFVLFTRGRPKLELTSADGDLIVKLRGRDVVIAFRRRIAIPLNRIAAVEVMASKSVQRHGMRLPGTEIPRFVRAGSYGRGRSREFWDVRRGKELLVIDTAGADPYARLVLEVEDPQNKAAWLRTVAGQATS